MNLFNVTDADIQAKIAPANSDYEFSVGASGSISSADVSGVIGAAQDRLVSSLPYKYRRCLAHVEEALSRYTPADASGFATSFYPVSNLKVYVNYQDTGKGWTLRNADDVTDRSYTADASGSITFSQPLQEGSRVYAEYDHTYAPNLPLLKDAVATLSAIEIQRRFWFHRAEEGAERFNKWQEDYDKWVEDIQRGRMGIAEIDKLDLVDDEGSPLVEDFYRTILNL